ncbi:MAG: hypothetical protein QQW96_21605 [Tychonema bourrellyi B0820]|uniref:DUF697 domain-containing protein n=1 Tax=Tychonema bourrellyi FEM_GT703 TaxID=2040638 RepID=A0A2G4EVV1_9CYAN|nr:hypothetical protein [Tychonema bourrellyi]MDQ2100231.1 hypothetical protein [Tychonema bourrellyi B0820]PHX53576.1 hypothetical protein CP500_020760 [Tychonema bourrellyi FEM_GT703]
MILVIINHLKHLMPRRSRARLHTIIHAAATEATAVGFATAQIPGDRFVIGAIQVNMTIELAAEFGATLDTAAAMSVITTGVSAFIGVETFNAIIKYAPGVGNVANMVTAASITETLGWAIVEYYENRKK